MLLVLLVVPVTYGQDAQQLVRRHQYGEAIRQLRGATGTMDGLTPRQLGILGVAHLQRGYLLQDLAALQVDLGTRYFHRRDTSETAVPSRWTPYFRGRYLVAQGDCAQARRHFRTVLDDASMPGEYHARARIWQAACDARSGRPQRALDTWASITPGDDAAIAGELALARWGATGDDAPVHCGSSGGRTAAALRCHLWAALRGDDAEAAYLHQRRLLHEALPDQEQLVGADFTLRFYDPATLPLLALADFIAAVEAFDRIGTPQSALYAGIGAYEAGRDRRARRLLDEAGGPVADVVHAALDYRAGRRTDAEARWRRARQADPGAAIAWAGIAARLDGQQDAARRFARTFLPRPPSNRADARTLGQVLLRTGAPGDALALLDAAYPAEYDNQIAVIEPGFLATLAHARFLAGRLYYPMVRSHLATLAQTFPVAAITLDLAQAVTAPERAVSLHKRTD